MTDRISVVYKWNNKQAKVDKMLKTILIRGAITGIVAGIILTAFGWAVLTGLQREAIRQDAVQEYNCKHYGAAINNHYGRELCPIKWG